MQWLTKYRLCSGIWKCVTFKNPMMLIPTPSFVAIKALGSMGDQRRYKRVIGLRAAPTNFNSFPFYANITE